MTLDPPSSMSRGRAQLVLFGLAYLVYLAGRWVTGGDLATATEHAHWIVELERNLGVEVERSVQDALDGGVVMTLLSNVYLAAQLVVLPGALLFLFRRAPSVYRRLRDTVLAAWMLA